MVQKKRKSKRQNPRSRFRLQKNVKAKLRADKKLLKKQERKVPRHILITDEEKQIQDQQIEQNKLRQLNPVITKFEINSDLQTVLDSADIIIEVLDARDISKRSNIERVNYIYLSKIDLISETVLEKCLQGLGNNVFDVRNISELIMKCGDKKIGIIGHKNSGRNILSHKIQSSNVMDLMGTLDDSINLSSVLRNSVDYSKINVLKFIDDILCVVDRSDLALQYEVPDFTDTKAFLNSLINKQNIVEKMKRISLEEMGKRFLNDLYRGKVMWHYEVDKGKNNLQFQFKYDF